MEARFIRNLDLKVEAGDFYDAHQLCRSIFERYSKRKDVQGGLAFAEKYAEIFASHEQYELTVNLGQRSLEMLRALQIVPSLELIDRMATFLLLCPPDSTDVKYEFANQLIGWSKGCEQFGDDEEVLNGSKTLQALVADAYLNERKFGNAQNHMVFCDDASSMAELLIQWQAWGYPSETHFFTLRLICILLSREKIDVAKQVLSHIGIDWDADDVPAPLQAAYFLWASTHEKSHELFDLTSRKYALIFRVDPMFSRLMSVIEANVFGVKPEQGGMMGMLKSLIQGPNTSTPALLSN